MISLHEPKLSYCDLDLEDSNPFFAHDTLVYNYVSTCWVWLQKVAYKHSADWEQLFVTSVTSLTPEDTTVLSLL